jgi:uncharacterized protein (UPF0332 family)
LVSAKQPVVPPILRGFHAAQALIFERAGKVPKSHHGVHTEFLRLTKDDQRVDPDLRIFLSQTYNLKSIADYETGPGSKVTIERATLAVVDGHRFVRLMTTLIEAETEGL